MPRSFEPKNAYTPYTMAVKPTRIPSTETGKAVIGTQGILIPVGYDERKIPELYPDENPLPPYPRTRKYTKPVFETPEAREEFLRKKREASARWRLRKRIDKEDQESADEKEKRKKKTDKASNSPERNVQDATQQQKKKKNKSPLRRKEPEIPEGYYEIGRPLPEGYTHAKPYSAQTRYDEEHEERQRVERARLAALDESTMLQPIIEHLQATSISRK